MKPVVSVIIPVYKVERYIERCARSLFGQTLDGIEYIFVDDCSPDGSMRVLERVTDEYPDRKPWIKIVKHSENRGQAAARNSGMRRATAPYVIHCDSDDWVEPDMYALMHEAAVKAGADIVHCSYIEEYGSGGKVVSSKNLARADGREVLKDPRTPWYNCSLCTKLVKKSLYADNGIVCSEGLDMGEDLCTSFRLFLFARNMVCIDRPLYHYDRTNPTSTVTALTAKPELCEKLIENIRRTELFFVERGAAGEFHGALKNLKLQGKHKLLFSRYRNIELWRNTFPESHSNVWNVFNTPWRLKAVYLLAGRKRGNDGLTHFALSVYEKLQSMKTILKSAAI